MAAKKLAFELIKGATLPTMVMGDRHRLQQILTHLLENGLQFTKRGCVTMSTVLIDQDDATMHVRFAVEDTGIGIKPENKATLFSLFSKLPPGDEAAGRQSNFARKGRGAGVGLAISQQLIELMGGEIKCESEYGRGSRFEVSIALEKTPSMASIDDLPASPHPARVALHAPREGKPKAAPGAAAAEVSAEAGGKAKSLHVLVVEDNELNSWVVCNMLEAHGHTVARAFDGTEAVEAMAEQLQAIPTPGSTPRAFDLVLMDCSMPVMDGCTATALIRQMEAATSGPIDREPVPIVALTAFAMSRDRARCLQAGMDDYLTKPVECATLLKLIGRLARRGTQKHEPLLGALATPPDGKGDSFDATQHSPHSDIPALEAHYHARVRKITRSLQQSAQRAQLPIVQLEAEQLLGLSVLPELRAVRDAVQRVLSLCATDPAAACTAVVEVANTVRAALGAEKDSSSVEAPVVVQSSSGNLLFRAPHRAVPTSFAPQNTERSSFAPTAASSAARPHSGRIATGPHML